MSLEILTALYILTIPTVVKWILWIQHQKIWTLKRDFQTYCWLSSLLSNLEPQLPAVTFRNRLGLGTRLKLSVNTSQIKLWKIICALRKLYTHCIRQNLERSYFTIAFQGWITASVVLSQISVSGSRFVLKNECSASDILSSVHGSGAEFSSSWKGLITKWCQEVACYQKRVS